MGIAEDIYARCRQSTAGAHAVLQGIINGEAIDPVAVTARRCAADIAADTTISLLRHAFITPIDREDLWLLRTAAEQVLYTAEEAALCLYRCGRQMPAVCGELMHAAAACCTAAEQVVDRFPKCDACAGEKRAIREAQRLYHTSVHRFFADATARRVCDATYPVITACAQLIDTLQYAALKNA